jgi:endonuclease/exonuclease/phosphatase family metal-dependent hydrolase
MKVMSFNIRFGTAKDGPNNWEFRKNILFNLLRKHEPDIVGMQEVEQFQLIEILNALNGVYASLGEGRNGNEHGEMSPILFKKDKLFSVSSSTFWLSNTPHIPGSASYGNRLPRICTWSRFVTLDEKKEAFLFVNTHLDHESEKARVEGAKQIQTFIGEKIDVNKKVIVTGDFNNASVNSEEIRVFSSPSSNFVDSFHAANGGVERGTFHYFRGTSNNSNRIDFIFVRGFSVIESNIIEDNDSGKYPSDHFPIYTIVKI